MTSEKSNDIRWIVGGAVAILIAGMTLIGVLSLGSSRDQTATIASIGTLVTMGVAGVFGLYKLNEGVQKGLKENTEITEAVAKTQGRMETRLNGDLDRRIAEASRQAVVDAMPSIKQAMVEVLDAWTRPVQR